MKKKKMLLIIILIVVISIGFSAISTTLSITGNSTIARNTWDVHFENVQVTSGSVTSPTPVISNNDTQVTYNVTLNMPGDYYEFTVDAVNEGTIDAMIQTFSNTGLTTAQEKYLSYSIKYESGADLANKHLLAHGTTEKYKVRVDYKKDLNSTDLPNSDQTITLTFSVNYVQADDSAVEVDHSIVLYVVSNTTTYMGQGMPNGINARLTPTEAMADWADIIGTPGETRPYYLKHVLLNNLITESYVEFVVTEERATANPGMTAGTYQIRGADSGNNYNLNKTTLLSAYGSSYCTDNTSYLYCSVPGLEAYSKNSGSLYVRDSSTGYSCHIDSYIFSKCGQENN
ncbi:MAG: hypothetical protein IKH54_02860 [Bacilli bacterium]|nr:hypothetical protein [Bacilli bacterium]